MSASPTTSLDSPLGALFERARALAGEGPCGRYAPSPTGALHAGNVRTALVAWLQARRAGGRFVMRMEDLDQPRVVAGSAAQILEDLRWLGLEWDEGPDVGGPLGPYVQSERVAIYRAVLDALSARDLVYPCYCSRKDIAEAASAPHGPGGALVYPGRCAGLAGVGPGPVGRGAEGRRAAWRFRVGQKVGVVEDAIAGRFEQDLAREVGDFVVERADGLIAYQLAVCVDDILMGVTDVVRGADLLDSAPRQVLLWEALGFAPPTFWHAPLMRDEAGQRLSKRDGSRSIGQMRQMGMGPEQVLGMLAASLGWATPGECLDARALLARVSLEDIRALGRDAGADAGG